VTAPMEIPQAGVARGFAEQPPQPSHDVVEINDGCRARDDGGDEGLKAGGHSDADSSE